MIFIPHERFENDNQTVQYWGGIRWVFISVMNLQSGHQIWCQMPNLVLWEKSRKGFVDGEIRAYQTATKPFAIRLFWYTRNKSDILQLQNHLQ